VSDDRIEQDERLNGADDRPDLRVDPMADGLDGETDGAEGVEKDSTGSTDQASHVWQVPLVVASIAAILAAAWYRNKSNPVDQGQQKIAQVSMLIEEGRFEPAANELRELAASLSTDDKSLLAGYHALVGDWRAAQVAGIANASAGESESIIAAYERAVEDGWVLTDLQALNIAEANLAAGRLKVAERSLESLQGVGPADMQLRVAADLRSLAQRRIDAMVERGEDHRVILAAVDDYVALEPGPAGEAWAVEFRAGLRMDSGDVAGLAERMIIDLSRLEPIDDGTVDWAPLHALLGEVYREGGRSQVAAERFEYVLVQLTADGKTRARCLRNLAEISLADGRSTDAESYFRRATETSGVSVYDGLASEIGLGLTLARLDRHTDAAEVLAVAMGRMVPTDIDLKSRLTKGLQEEGLAALLAAGGKSQSDALMLRHAALEYARLALETNSEDLARQEALKLKAAAHHAYAQTLLDPLLDGEDVRDVGLDVVPLTVRVEVNQHLVSAGETYLELDGLFGTGASRPDGEFLWDAAVAFDQGGHRDQAIVLYGQYLEEQPLDDDRRTEALFRVALAHHSALEFSEAVGSYRALLSTVDGASENEALSNFVTRAKVGLARCLAGSPTRTQADLEEAEVHLRDICDGREAIGPSALEYREAMFQLGRVLAGREQWTESVEVMEEALQRYTNDVRVPEYAARAGLGWLEIARMNQQHLDASPLAPGRKAEVEAAMVESLRSAVKRFDLAVAGLDDPAHAPLDPLESQLLRQAYLRRADAVAELGQYDMAMDHYAAVERRFGEEPTALEALVRMANLAHLQGDEGAARSATNRARVKLRRVRPGQISGPDLLGGIGTDALEKWIALQPPGAMDGGPE
jgi:tetratricopeptide (TPR) repeat protein